MADKHTLRKVFLRAVITGPNGLPLASLDVAKARLTQLVLGQFTAIADSGGLVQISSQIGDTAFGFATAKDIDQATIVSIAEDALEAIEQLETANPGATPLTVQRALLRKHKSQLVGRVCLAH